MAQINSAAHASFSTMMQVIILGPNAAYLKPYKEGGDFDHISVYCHYLNNVHKLFKTGKTKVEVLTELIDWHLPKNLNAAQAAAAAGRAEKKEKEASEKK
jgi:hypothetical protein